MQLAVCLSAVFAILGLSSGYLFSRKVCYNELGCYSTDDVRGVARPVVLLPDEPDKIGTRFFLYTRKNPTTADEEELMRKDATSFTSSEFNHTRPTKIIIHGFLDSAHVPWVQKMVAELLKYDDYNVIAVDWRNGAGFPYTQATANVRLVAAELTKLLEALTKQYPYLTPQSIHMIGHSLGAHCASEVGTNIKNIGRISGLDPVELYFEGAIEDVRLEKRDAEFVDVIHSDGSTFFSNLGMGYKASIGHVDFFPNGGSSQPGCDKSATVKVIGAASSAVVNGLSGAKDSFACSHYKAVDYYIESINGKCPFIAYPCNSYDDFKAGKCLSCTGGKCSAMGFHSDLYPSKGNFYLYTNQKGEQPFCSYHYQVSVTAGVMSGRGYGKVSLTLMNDKNQTYGPISMADKDVYIDSKTEIQRTVIVPKSLGDVTKVTILYEKDDCITCFLYSDFIRLQRIELTSGETQKQTLFCGKNLSVATKNARYVNAEATLGGC